MQHISKKLSLALLLSSVCFGAAWAQANPVTPKQSMASVGEGRMLVNISADVQEDVDADVVSVTLSKQLEGQDQKALSDELNQAINKVIELAKSEPALTVKTGNYSFWSNTEKDKSSWIVRGEVFVTSSDFEKVRGLIAQASGTMNLDGINFSLSDAKRKDSEARLIAKAADAFRERASSVAAAFAAKDYTIKRVNVQTNRVIGNGDVVYRAAKGLSSYGGGESVQLSSGKVSVQVATEGEIALH